MRSTEYALSNVCSALGSRLNCSDSGRRCEASSFGAARRSCPEVVLLLHCRMPRLVSFQAFEIFDIVFSIVASISPTNVCSPSASSRRRFLTPDHDFFPVCTMLAVNRSRSTAVCHIRSTVRLCQCNTASSKIASSSARPCSGTLLLALDVAPRTPARTPRQQDVLRVQAVDHGVLVRLTFHGTTAKHSAWTTTCGATSAG